LNNIALRGIRQTSIARRLNSSILGPMFGLMVLSLLVFAPLETYLFFKSRALGMRKIQEGVGNELRAVAVTAALQIQGEKHSEIFGKLDSELSEFQEIQTLLRNVQKNNAIEEEIYTLRLEEKDSPKARFVVMTGEKNFIGDEYVFPKLMRSTFISGKSSVTGVYKSRSREGKRWMSAFAPIKEPGSELFAVLEVDQSVETVLTEFEENNRSLITFHSLRGVFLVFLFIALFLLIKRIIKSKIELMIRVPFEVVIEFIHKVRDGDLKAFLDIKSGDELEVLSDSFNEMVAGLRQKETMGKFLTPMALKEVRAISDGEKELNYSGEKKMVTVLFSDIRSFTSICEDADPSNIIRALNHYFDHLVPIIEGNGGSLDKLIGDCIMAVFEQREGFNDAEAAVESAIQMQQGLVGLREQMIEEGMPEFHAGFGINSGESVVGNLGARNQVSRTVLGDTVNLAARVEALSKQGKQTHILFTEDTRNRLIRKFYNTFLMETVVKGKTKPVKVYEINTVEMG